MHINSETGEEVKNGKALVLNTASLLNQKKIFHTHLFFLKTQRPHVASPMKIKAHVPRCQGSDLVAMVAWG